MTTTADREIINTRLVNAERELVFQAYTDPEHVGQWWGPKGFTSTIHEMDARPGGVWRFILHGPDGVDYKNQIVFVEVVNPTRIVFDHVSSPRFRVIVTLDQESDKTRITFRQIFETVAEYERIKTYASPANEENFDRLELELDRMATSD